MNTELHLVLGPMFAGKSSFMIQKINELINSGISEQEILAINHSSDSRYDTGKICSHNGKKIDSITTNTLNSIFNKFANSKYIFIDEGQFFSDLYISIKNMINTFHQGKIIYISGLDGDYNQLPFKQSGILDLIPLAITIIKLTANCSNCNNKAPYTKRLIQSDQTILVGGADVYQPVCLYHLHN